MLFRSVDLPIEREAQGRRVLDVVDINLEQELKVAAPVFGLFKELARGTGTIVFAVLTMPAERSGLTMACVAIPRRVFFEVGGVSLEFPRAFNDVDFGNKLDSLGYRMIWTPHVQIHHFESASRDPRVDVNEVTALWDRWGRVVLRRDKYLPSFDFAIHGLPLFDRP